MKAVVIVDGLNLYHALRNFGPTHTNLDLFSLSRRLLEKETADIMLYYYTAPPQDLGFAIMREYLAYKEKLEKSGVTVVEGRFQKSKTTCKSCGFRSEVLKEKETDVSIAIRICETSLDRSVNQIVLFSADSDLAPALLFARRQNPNLRITIAQTGKFLKFAAYSMVSKADQTIKLSSDFIHKYQFKG